jgi:DNA-directed RNA polymerase specialized sigma24 family protein
MRSGLVPLALASDRQLAERVGDGSEQAFEVLRERHGPQVGDFCRRMLGPRAEAEVALQGTFLAAFRDLVRGHRPRATRAWLLGIARRRCRAVAAACDELRGLPRDLASLPEAQRTALVLSEIGGLSQRDIAEILGCRRDEAKALVAQARASLAASREARDAPCADVRRQLTTLEAGPLRPSVLRRHLHDCEGCRAFRDAGRRTPDP